MTGQPERGLGEGAAAGHDEGGHQLVVSHVPGRQCYYEIAIIMCPYFIRVDLSSTPGFSLMGCTVRLLGQGVI